ncbi:MAG: regulator of chromosome condensation 1/beta-lactamase-inhibitor protein II [Linnemannia gamsii]|nr:MAG: regulator of chromosome condensation 1/beta-lactamase-inhibitor protein II [Linnemannia gamsii]
MLRIGHQAGRGLTRITAFRAPIHSCNHRALSSATTRTTSTSSNVTQNAAWVIGAGVVFTGATLVLQSPSFGFSRVDNMVHNDSPTNNTGKQPQQQSIRSSLETLLGFKKQPKIEQADIVLDTELTVTSWKQQEQDALVKAPGIMLWGSNKNGLVDPTGRSPGVIQIPQRLTAFQGKVLRDLKLGDDFAAAVDEDGNVYQWGSGYNQQSHQPEATLTNRDITQVTLCDSKLYGLSKDGSRIYVLPKVRPMSGPTKAAIDYQKPKGSVLRYVGLGGSVDDKHDPMAQLPMQDLLQKDERILSMSSGKNHMVMVTSHGRVFGSDDGLSVSLIGDADFRQSRILEVACGEVHTLARDDQGRGWAWGVNGFGQLAQGVYSHANLKLPNPTLIKDISGTEGGVECVRVAAGGQSSYFVLKEKNVFKVKSAGMGQWGQLGDGSYTHIQGSLVTIAPLSNLAEFKEQEKKMMPIGIHDLAIGSTHGFAVLDNAITKDKDQEASTTSTITVTHGRDVLSWGQNTYYQLLTGKRTNKTEPVHSLPLDSDILQPADKAVAAIAQGTATRSSSTEALSATNRLQLMPAQPRPDQLTEGKKQKKEKEVKEFVELKIVAGNGVSGVYCSTATTTESS